MRKDGKACPYIESCIGKSQEKKVEIIYHLQEYERGIKQINSRYGRKMKGLRQATVEPVLVTLINFLGLRKINTRGME